jgi:hypothetical protein
MGLNFMHICRAYRTPLLKGMPLHGSQGPPGRMYLVHTRTAGALSMVLLSAVRFFICFTAAYLLSTRMSRG